MKTKNIVILIGSAIGLIALTVPIRAIFGTPITETQVGAAISLGMVAFIILGPGVMFASDNDKL